MDLVIAVSVASSVCTVKFTGTLDYSTAENFIPQDEIPQGISSCTLDFSSLEFIDSTGIGLIISILHEAKDRNIGVVFASMNPETEELFDTIGVFKIREQLLRKGC
jgi:anti-anti-sigma factor